MSDSVPVSSTQPRPKRRRWLWLIVLLTALIFLFWIGLLVRDGLVLRADVLALQDYAAALPQPIKPTDVDLTLVKQHVVSLDENVRALQNHAGPLLALTPLLGWLPEIGGDVQAAPALLNMALEITGLSRRVVTTLEPLWPPQTEDDHITLPSVARLLQALQPAMESWHGYLDRAQRTRQRVDVSRLSPRLRSWLERYDEAAPLAQNGLAVLEAAPQLLGADRPRTYLILFQNEDELRATGGFISAAGRLTIDAGKIISLTVEDSYAVDDFTTPYPDPPAPLNDYMGSDLWVFRDSNWSPDFPAAARQAISLYTQTRPGTIDGVIALNQQVVGALIDALGPLTIDGQTIANAQGMQDYMRKAWEPSSQTSVAEWVTQRKNFIGRAMPLLLDRLLTGQAVNWPVLGQGLNRVLQSRDLLILLNDPRANQPLHTAQLDGALRAAGSDYLLVVDSNMGFNKASAAMQQAMHYTVTLNTSSAPQAELTIAYTNTNPPGGACIHGAPDYGLNITYEQLVQQCYWLYRRVLVPAGAELLDASRHPTGPGELVIGRISDGTTRVTEEDDKTVFGTFLLIPRGRQVDSYLRYALPASVTQVSDGQLRYHLIWQKQPGAAAWPVRVTVVFPAGASLLEAHPQPISTANDAAAFEFALSTDAEVDVWLRMK